jgi:TIR domain
VVDLPPIEIFFSYAHEDEALMNSVRQQLVIYERLGKIVKWHDRQIPAGDDWASAIDHRLQHCHIILLLVSPAFIESKYCWDVEVKVALARHERGEARVIPIILRPCPWDAAPFARLQALPRDGKPLSQWPDRDQACLDIAKGLMAVVDEIQHTNAAAPPPPIKANDIPKGKFERRMLEGDRIARIIAPFQPPTGVNIPPGYQRRLNYLAAEVVRESAVRRQDGLYEYPVHVKGPPLAVQTFESWAASIGRAEASGIQAGPEISEFWFEYVGDNSPNVISDAAVRLGLQVIQCGATLLSSPQSPIAT